MDYAGRGFGSERTGNNLLGNTSNIYIDPSAIGTLDLTDDFYDYTSSGATQTQLKIKNLSATVTVTVHSYDTSAKSDAGP